MTRLKDEFVDVLVHGQPIRAIAVAHGGVRPVGDPGGDAVVMTSLGQSMFTISDNGTFACSSTLSISF